MRRCVRVLRGWVQRAGMQGCNRARPWCLLWQQQHVWPLGSPADQLPACLVFPQRCLDNGKEVNVPFAVKISTITRGLKYSLATGNWGAQGEQGIRAGVSQVGGAWSTWLAHA